MADCPFCSEDLRDRIVDQKGTVLALRDLFPVTKGHTLIIPQRHTPDFFTMTPEERADMQALLIRCKKALTEEDDTISAFNFGMNCGADSGQTVFHAHLHLIPRRKGDADDPQGGVRGVIPDRQKY